ncbi:MAG: hypothetical protein ACTSUF_04330 [Candidatus Heimdallarchaeaceae archaeon]
MEKMNEVYYEMLAEMFRRSRNFNFEVYSRIGDVLTFKLILYEPNSTNIRKSSVISLKLLNSPYQTTVLWSNEFGSTILLGHYYLDRPNGERFVRNTIGFNDFLLLQ